MTSKVISSRLPQGLSAGKRKKLAAVLIVGLLLALPLSFAAANPQAVQSAAEQVQIALPGSQVAAQAPASQEAMSFEEGIAQLTCSDLRVMHVSSGSNYTLAVLSDGTLWSWGFGGHGRLGNGQTGGFVMLPAQVGTSTDWRYVSAGLGIQTAATASFGIKADGSLWSWGDNLPAGHGPTGSTLVPTLLCDNAEWAYISSGVSQTLALQSDGTLWSWGQGGLGQLGHGTSGTSGNVISPTRVGTSTWQSVNVFANHSVGVQSDGTLWSWGATGGFAFNQSLVLGRSVSANYPAAAPGQIGILDTWQLASAGRYHSHAIQTDGTLWGWGYSTGNQLGVAGPNAFTPVQIINTLPNSSPNEWQSISARAGMTVALQSDGTLWSWGSDFLVGQTGHGNSNDNIPIPTQIGSATWEFIAEGDATFLVIQDNGELWGWGHSEQGQLGIGFTPPPGGPLAHLATPTFIMPVELEVTSVTPAGNRVSVSAENIVITFNFPISMVAGEKSVTFEGAELNVSAGTWSENYTVLTIPIPDLPMPYETPHTVVVSGFRAARGGAMCADYIHTFITEAPAPEVNLTKVLQTPEGTTLPTDASFIFEFEPVQVQLSEEPLVYSRPVADIPAIANQTITIDAALATTAAGVTTASGSLDLWPILDSLTFSYAGFFVWNVTEQANSTATVAPSNMSYDNAAFQIRALVDRYGNLYRLDIHSLDYDEGVWTIGPKLDSGPFFTNVYTRLTTDNNHLAVTKYIEGEFADRSTRFDFTLTLAAHALAPLEFPLTATIIGADNNPVADARNPVAITGATTTFELSHEERLQLPELPLGTTFAVTEAAHIQFAPEVEVIIGGASVHTDSEDVDTALSTGPHIIAGAGRNAADFTNVHYFVPPTGLVMENPLFALPLLAFVALISILTVRRRRAIERLPIA